METKIFNTSAGHIIRYKLYNKKRVGKQDLVIIVHGFKGFMDWGFFPFAAEKIAGAGYPVLCFNFSHNGVGEDLVNFTQLDKFALNNYSLEVDELNQIIKAFESNYFGNKGNTKVSLIGHSRGSLAVVINSQIEIVKSFVTWAGISNPDRFSNRQKKEWRKEGVFNVLNARTNQLMSMSVKFLDDMEENLQNKLNIKNVLSKNKKPFLIIQGEQDLAVKVNEAKNLYNWNRENAQIEILPSTGHTFDAVHPFKEESENLKKVLNKTINFLEEII